MKGAPLEKEHSTATIDGFLSDLTKEESSVAEQEPFSSKVVDLEVFMKDLTEEVAPPPPSPPLKVVDLITTSKINEFEGFLNDLAKESTLKKAEGMFSSHFSFHNLFFTIIFFRPKDISIATSAIATTEGLLSNNLTKEDSSNKGMSLNKKKHSPAHKK